MLKSLCSEVKELTQFPRGPWHQFGQQWQPHFAQSAPIIQDSLEMEFSELLQHDKYSFDVSNEQFLAQNLFEYK